MSSSRRILVIAGFAPSLIKFRGPLLRQLVSTGMDVHCAAPEDDLDVARQLAEWGIHYVPVPLKRNTLGVWNDLRYLVSVWKLCRALRPEVVLAYTVKPVVFGCSAAAWAGVPRRYALITGLGYVFTGDSSRHRRLQRVVLALYRYALGRCARVLFQNPDDRDEFVARGVVDGEKCALVNGSGVDLDVFRFAPLPAGGGTIFLLIARLLGDKGIREYAQAAALVRRSYPDARFWLVGPGDPSPDAISETEVKGWEQSGAIEYFGEAADVLPFLEKASVYVLPSYREGTPRTVLEAMAVGRPVITTDAPGCRETVADGDNGYLVPVRNVEALAKAMCRFLDNPELIKQMGRRSREIAEERFDVHKVNKQMLAAMGL